MGPVLMRVAVGAGEWAAGCLRVWCSSVLHMGGEGLCGTRGWFLLGLWVFLMIVVCGGRAPMCGEGVCAHGSGVVVITDVSFPHDSAVSIDAGCT